jgi:chromatin segregation and condensation protein Rec8/ScpA/Scc1 (kleisin family)
MSALPCPSNEIIGTKSYMSRSYDIVDSIDTYLTPREIQRIDMIFFGNLILQKAIRLSQKIDSELIIPLRAWLKDPDWISKIRLPENKTIDWKEYKRNARQWDKQQQKLYKNRLKLYRQALRSKQIKRKKIAKLIGRLDSIPSTFMNTQYDFMIAILAPFSKNGLRHKAVEQEFIQSRAKSIFYLLPWQVLIGSELKYRILFSDLTIYLPENRKQDKVCKLMTLLELENSGFITLKQSQAFEEIEIHPKNNLTMGVMIKDQKGNKQQHNWADLNQDKRIDFIKKIIAHKIICKHNESP